MSFKWSPFNAVASGSYMVNEVLGEKSKVKMPVLSDDQKNNIQERIFESFNNQEVVKVMYYSNGKIYEKSGKITNIDGISHKVMINDNFFIFFSQIIEIY